MLKTVAIQWFLTHHCSPSITANLPSIIRIGGISRGINFFHGGINEPDRYNVQRRKIQGKTI